MVEQVYIYMTPDEIKDIFELALGDIEENDI